MARSMDNVPYFDFFSRRISTQWVMEISGSNPDTSTHQHRCGQYLEKLSTLVDLIQPLGFYYILDATQPGKSMVITARPLTGQLTVCNLPDDLWADLAYSQPNHAYTYEVPRASLAGISLQQLIDAAALKRMVIAKIEDCIEEDKYALHCTMGHAPSLPMQVTMAAVEDLMPEITPSRKASVVSLAVCGAVMLLVYGFVWWWKEGRNQEQGI